MSIDDEINRNCALAAEIHRHQCEVRYICRLGDQAPAYLAEVAKRRGQDAADKLRDDAREQYARGNRGAEGDWR